MYWVDLKYLKLIPLEGMTQVRQNVYNFRCPVCGDSKKSKHKKRGYAFEYNSTIIFKCFNCNFTPLPISVFLKNYYPTLYDEYLKESYFEKKGFKRSTENVIDLFSTTYDSLNLQLLNSLPIDHPAVEYIRNRKITPEQTENFYYTDNFKKWVHESIDTSQFKGPVYKDRRIVIPYFNRFKKIFAVQGRTIDNDKVKYITIKIDKDEKKIYGLDKIDFNKNIMVLEGALDSILLPNAISLGGSLSDLEYLLKFTNRENLVIVPDNDRYNAETKRMILESLSKGFKTVVWPKSFKFKDINECLINNLTIKEILDIISSNATTGLDGIAKLKLRGLL